MINQTAWLIFSLPSIILASSIHEYAHALTAYKLGDDTAKRTGRMTLNPLAHIDVLGVVAMALFRIGWSKPVPVNSNNFKNPALGNALVALSGPVSNFTLAVLLGFILRFSFPFLNHDAPVTMTILTFLVTFIIVNIVLGSFNILPIPPLDGHKIVSVILPKKLRYYWNQLDRFGIFIVLLIFMPFSPIAAIFNDFINFMVAAILNFSLS
jgi:Zn-dependent protease